MKRGTVRTLGVLVLALSGACGSDDVPLTVRLSWSDGCTMGGPLGCIGATHAVIGSQGSPTIDTFCAISRASDGYHVYFRGAVLQPGETSFDLTSEGIAVGSQNFPVIIPMIGGEAAANGTIVIRGRGWVANGTTGPVGPCHVYLDGNSGQDFRGRIRCENLLDDSMPARPRYVRGQSGMTADPNFAEYNFTNCATAD